MTTGMKVKPGPAHFDWTNINTFYMEKDCETVCGQIKPLQWDWS